MSQLRDLIADPTQVELELIERYASLPETPQRTRNFEAFAETGLPGRRTEAWRWTDLKRGLKSVTGSGDAAMIADPFDGVCDGPVIVLTSSGCRVEGKLASGIRMMEQDKPQALGGAEDLPVAALGAALSNNPGALVIEVSEPQDVSIRLRCEGQDALRFSRVSFILRKGVSLTVAESHLAGAGFSSVVVEYGLEDDATLQRVVYMEAKSAATQVVTGLIHLNDRARLVQTHFGTGAHLARLETRVFHHGEAASATLNGAYLLADGRHFDQTSVVRHSCPGSSTTQRVKGAVRDGGRAAFRANSMLHGARKRLKRRWRTTRSFWRMAVK